jgi:hypothetical protein
VSSRKLFLIIGGCFAAAGLAYVLVIIALFDGFEIGMRFETTRWREADLSTRERARMVQSLIRSGRLDDLDRRGVEQLLGASASADGWDGADMMYELGPTKGIGMDSEYLLIDLNRDGRVASYSVAQG